MYQKLLKIYLHILKQEHLIMPLLKFGEMNLTILKPIYGLWDVSFTKCVC